MDRTIPQVGQLPVIETFSLLPQRNAMIGIGALSQAVIGQENASPAVAVDGFTISPTSPASLVVVIGPGSIYAQGVVDATDYGVLPADNADTITQQGIALAPTSLTLTPPSTGGFSTNYVIQVGLSVQDNTPVVNPFYNAANPSSNWEGPNNSGVTQNTIRQCVALIQAKAGVAATSGTQITPSPDPGFFGLYSVTVANGATALTSGNWSTLSTAPYIPAPLMAIPQAVQSGKWIYAADTGTANALVVTLAPPPLALVTGLEVRVKKIASANTGAATIVVNGSSAIPIKTITGSALIGNEMPASGMLDLLYDGTNFQLQSAISPAQVALMHFSGAGVGSGDTGTANAMVVTAVYPVVSTVVTGMHFTITKSSLANSGAMTANIMGTTAAVTWGDLTPFTGGEWAANADGIVVYDGNWRLVGITTPFSFVIPGSPVPLLAPRTYYVNVSTGSDSNTGLSSGNAFASIQKAISVTQSLNMNGYSVHTFVADGTYVPFTCGPLNGAGTHRITGNLTTQANVIVAATTGEAANVGASGYILEGMTFTSAAAGSAPHIGAGVRCVGGLVVLTNVGFGACATAHVYSDIGPNNVIFLGTATGNPGATVQISGASPFHLLATGGGTINVGQPALTITGTPAFSTAFWEAVVNASINGSYASITGTATGVRFNVDYSSTINTAGAGLAYLPGNASGTQGAHAGFYL